MGINLSDELFATGSNLFVIFKRIGLLRTFRKGVDHVQVHVDSDVHELADDGDDLLLGHYWKERRVDDVPEFSGLCLITPVFAEEPADEDHVLNVVLRVQVAELRIEVAQSLSLASFGKHFIVVKSDLVRDGLEMLGVEVHSVAETLDGRLVTSEFDLVKSNRALGCE